MPLNKANFDGRATDPSNDDIVWEVTFTVTDTSSPRGSGTSGSQAAPGGNVTKTASFPVGSNATAVEIAASLKDSWNARNPEYTASSESGDNSTIVFPSSAAQQRYKVGSGEWQMLGPSFSDLVEGVEVSDSET